MLLGNSEFESLVDLISYYEKHPLYRKMKLRYPINEETLEKIGTAVSVGLLEELSQRVMDRSILSWCLGVVLCDPSLCFTVHISWGFLSCLKHFLARVRFIAVPLTQVSRECGLGHLFAASSLVLCFPWGVLPTSPKAGELFLGKATAVTTGPLLPQEPDYGALYEGRHPGFYVEANPMPTFKVRSYCLA